MTKLRRDQFPHRAKVIFYARLAIDSFALLFLLFPKWNTVVAPFLGNVFLIYLFILSSHLFSYLWIEKKFGRVIYFISLCFDIITMGSLIVLSGGLASPLMSGLILYTVVFALLYPHPLAIIPPLLLLPVVAKINQLVGTDVPARDLILLLWYSGLDLIIVYVVVYFDFQANIQFWREKKLQKEKDLLLVMNEQQRMAREMHDGLGASLSAIKIQAEFLSEISKGLGEVEEESSTLHNRTAQALIELRRTVRILREDFELENSMDELIQSMEGLWGYNIILNSKTVTLNINKKQQLNIYRIIQESLTNSGKHARANKIHIDLMDSEVPKWTNSIDFEKKGFSLTIRDDGVGFSPKEKKEGHYGLIHLSERANVMGGFCKIKSKKGQGTTIKMWLPYC
jgi:two-component system, NarL family, sensor histidine kinase DegS